MRSFQVGMVRICIVVFTVSMLSHGGCSQEGKLSIPETKAQLHAEGLATWADYFGLYVTKHKALEDVKVAMTRNEPDTIGEAIIFYSNNLGFIASLGQVYIVRPLDFRMGSVFRKAEKIANENEKAERRASLEYRAISAPEMKDEVGPLPATKLTEKDMKTFKENYSYLVMALFMNHIVQKDSHTFRSVTDKLLKSKAYKNEQGKEAVERLTKNKDYLEWLRYDSKQVAQHKENLLVTFERVAQYAAISLQPRGEIIRHLTREIFEAVEQDETHIQSMSPTSWEDQLNGLQSEVDSSSSE